VVNTRSFLHSIPRANRRTGLVCFIASFGPILLFVRLNIDRLFALRKSLTYVTSIDKELDIHRVAGKE